MTDQNDEPHVHQWEAPGAWGVIVGVSRCTVCDKVSERSDFPALEAATDER